MNGMKKMRNIINIIMMILIMSSLVNIADAATYYVRTDGHNANCNGLYNAGSMSAPNCAYSSIQKGHDAASAGDTIRVQQGTYSGQWLRILKSGSSGSPITYIADGEVILTGTYSGFRIDGQKYIVINGFKITGTGYDYDGYIYLKGAAEYNQILNNVMYNGDNHSPGIACEGVNNNIKGNAIKNMSYTGLVLGGSHNIFENNTLSNIIGSDAMNVFGHDNIIRGNYIEHIEEQESNGQHSDIIQTWGPGESYNILFEGNYVYHSRAQIGMFSQDGGINVRDWTFRNNVYIDIEAQANIYAPNFKWYNNTFYCSRIMAGEVLEFRNGAAGSGNNGDVRNNIFVGCGSLPNSTGWYKYFAGTTGGIADYNYVAKGPWDSVPYGAKSGFTEVHGINGGDPKFVALDAGNVRLRADSPAIDKGTEITSFGKDFTGTPRPQGAAWDIGAYEYRSATALGTPQNFRKIN